MSLKTSANSFLRITLTIQIKQIPSDLLLYFPNIVSSLRCVTPTASSATSTTPSSPTAALNPGGIPTPSSPHTTVTGNLPPWPRSTTPTSLGLHKPGYRTLKIPFGFVHRNIPRFISSPLRIAQHSLFTRIVQYLIHHFQQHVGIDERHVHDGFPRLTFPVGIGSEVGRVVFRNGGGRFEHQFGEGWREEVGALGWQDAQQLSEGRERFAVVERERFVSRFGIVGRLVVEVIEIDHIGREGAVEMGKEPIPRLTAVVIIIENPVQSFQIITHVLTTEFGCVVPELGLVIIIAITQLFHLFRFRMVLVIFFECLPSCLLVGKLFRRVGILLIPFAVLVQRAAEFGGHRRERPTGFLLFVGTAFVMLLFVEAQTEHEFFEPPRVNFLAIGEVPAPVREHVHVGPHHQTQRAAFDLQMRRVG
mmetsp:Transcript_11063/g.11164  ORF Transcript_11063/g.11164 Transcript_11063/m.11164 type:complete len:419 (+) Transcript_11063:99-1355(+)